MNPLLSSGVRPVPPSAITAVGSESVEVVFSDTERLGIRYSLPKTDGYDPNELRVYLLKKADLPEQSIIEVKLDKGAEKAGHLFPIQLFETEEAGFLEPAHDNPRLMRFQKVALAALSHLAREYHLSGEGGAENGPVSLVRHFGDDTVVLTISNDSKRVPEDFDLANYLPSLFKYGYLKHGVPSDGQGVRLGVPFEDVSQLTVLTLKRVSAEIPNIEFVRNIFIELLPTSWSPIMSIFLCYQVIEACIERIRLENCDEFIRSLNASKNDAVMTRNAIGEYQREASEKERIRRLFSEFLSTGTANSFSEGKELLRRLGVKEKDLSRDGDILYDLRNYFFHAFPVVRGQCTEDQMKTVSWEFLLLTLEVLFRFIVPSDAKT